MGKVSTTKMGRTMALMNPKTNADKPSVASDEK